VVRRTARPLVAQALGALALAGVVVAWWDVRFGPDEPRVPLDTVLYFLPSYAAIAERFRQGVVPLWNPYHLCGLPWIGTLQGAVFYPAHVLYVVLPLHHALAASGVLHLVVTALATAAFVRRLGLGYAAAFLAAVVFTLRGTVATSVPSPNLLEAVTWLPVGAIAIVDLVRAPGGRSIALLAAATGLSFLAGYPQPTVYVVYTWGSLFLALLIPGGRRSRSDDRPRSAVRSRSAAVAAVRCSGSAHELGHPRAGGSERPDDVSVAAWRTRRRPSSGTRRSQAPVRVGPGRPLARLAAVFAPGRHALGVWAFAVTYERHHGARSRDAALRPLSGAADKAVSQPGPIAHRDRLRRRNHRRTPVLGGGRRSARRAGRAPRLAASCPQDGGPRAVGV
jgi:hypothetical protein